MPFCGTGQLLKQSCASHKNCSVHGLEEVPVVLQPGPDHLVEVRQPHDGLLIRSTFKISSLYGLPMAYTGLMWPTDLALINSVKILFFLHLSWTKAVHLAKVSGRYL